MVLIDMASKISRDVRVFTLDTGRLPEETYQMLEIVRDRYGIDIEVVFPDPAEVEAMTSEYGPNLFYRDSVQRMLCCEVRKVRPLERKLSTLDAWVTAVRRSQSESRSAVRKVEEAKGVVNICPLADWTKEQVDRYTEEHDVPQHPLYAKGYTSIGCAPCTRPTWIGENERAGRWWWEKQNAKECGIHFSANGKAQRQVDVL